MLKNDGKAAERGFLAKWSHAHVERLRDKADLVGLNGGRNIADFKKPSDFVVSAKHVPLHYAEVKSTTHATRFAFSNIKDGQSKAARLAASRGYAKSYIFYIYSLAHSQWYVMTAEKYAEVLDRGERSVLFSELEPWN